MECNELWTQKYARSSMSMGIFIVWIYFNLINSYTHSISYIFSILLSTLILFKVGWNPRVNHIDRRSMSIVFSFFLFCMCMLYINVWMVGMSCRVDICLQQNICTSKPYTVMYVCVTCLQTIHLFQMEFAIMYINPIYTSVYPSTFLRFSMSFRA